MLWQVRTSWKSPKLISSNQISTLNFMVGEDKLEESKTNIFKPNFNLKESKTNIFKSNFNLKCYGRPLASIHFPAVHE